MKAKQQTGFTCETCEARFNSMKECGEHANKEKHYSFKRDNGVEIILGFA